MLTSHALIGNYPIHAGKAGAAAPPAPAPAASPPSAARSGGFDTPASGFPGSNPYGSPPAPAPEPVKTKEQLERERKAAALFGGVVPGAAAPPAPSPPKPAGRRTAAAPPPAPAPEIDLLDMGAWDAPAPAAPAPAVDFDMLSPAPMEPAAAPAAQPAVETVSDDEGDAFAPQSVSAASAPPPAPAPTEYVDPFAAEGLLDALSDQPLTSLPSLAAPSQRFEYNGVAMAPAVITTAQFGQQWGGCKAQSPVEVNSSKVSTLDAFMDVCSNVGLHKVESITATNEGICAGMIGGTHVVLIHGKVSPGSKVNVTVKSTDPGVTGPLAMYLQTMLR